MRKISDSTIRRLSVYLRFLEQAHAQGRVTISSGELARLGGTTSAQVRKDLSFFGSFGKRGLGYAVPELARRIRDILGLERGYRVVLVGAGRMGGALAQYQGFKQRGFHIRAIYDQDAREIGALRSVLVHTPGKELVAVTPGTREDYLYDDIIDLEIAQREHRRLVAVLERFAEVHEVRDTLVEIAGRPEVREFLTTRALEVIPSDVLAKQMTALSSEDFVALMVEGALEDGGPIARALNEVAYALPPLPNLFFTRDVGIVIGEHAIIRSMRHGVRWNDELLVQALFRYDA